MFDLTYVKNKRLEIGYSLKDMADLLDIKNASTYYKYENGSYSFKAEMLPKLANALECDIENFFKEKVSKTEILQKNHV
ncbi:TPA_asm: XRE family transcriptional regulator [Listeria monocytogenes]|uniref:helix-turn-helix domain-containing protein n=1 Tax=Listeria TaxID=1637 RepID=UPI0017680416|nr:MULTISPECIES: helix-turn-helix transcriptional regulator [Listeria]HAA1162515.1 XRE family transcriptional regulator [Listeria monocytogenes]HAA1165020.1 XRE family transcriptional regulator [Listeria monocytogenes]HAA1170858.1 XRE family transcriptional regulator [Listeria monocytogenes]HAA1181010.1 XRE family transcriptional regulator [Listeria monocytogenes]HAA1183328.1 XRE family transcriptional regulator [Listeria monocytogenes]